MKVLAFSFAALVTISVDLGINAIGITSGDFNGDGRFDLAAANQVANTVTIALATCP